MIEPAHPQISIARQCDLVGLPAQPITTRGRGRAQRISTLMRLLDKQYTDTPYYGVRRMTAWLRSQGYQVNHKRVARLLHTMGIEAIYPKPAPESGASYASGLPVFAAGGARSHG